MNKDYCIVVGVDGSEGGVRALRWAVREAARRGGTINAVTAFTFGDIDGSGLTYRQRHELADQMLGDQVRAALAENPRVDVTARAVFGEAVEVLLNSAHNADLLVLGSHGHGRLYHAVVGSVAEACVRAGICPVVVVPVPASDTQTAVAQSAGMPAAIL
jgi:nucleotide-binding universal stress UspA family protein